MFEQEENFDFMKIKTYILKVHIHCEGCMRKVKKLLRKIQGVYEVKIDAEEHKVTVLGNVDGNSLIKKLAKSRKRAEFWPASMGDSLNNDGNLQSSMGALNFWENQPLPAHLSDGTWGLERYMNNDNQIANTQLYNGLAGWKENFTNDWTSIDPSMNPRMSFSGNGDLGGFNRLGNIYAGFPSNGYQFQLPATMNTGEWYGNAYPLVWNNIQNMHPTRNVENMYESATDQHVLFPCSFRI